MGVNISHPLCDIKYLWRRIRNFSFTTFENRCDIRCLTSSIWRYHDGIDYHYLFYKSSNSYPPKQYKYKYFPCVLNKQKLKQCWQSPDNGDCSSNINSNAVDSMWGQSFQCHLWNRYIRNMFANITHNKHNHKTERDNTKITTTIIEITMMKSLTMIMITA